jgi:pantetheine-phosphate adenylyltransferase
MDKIAIYPGSFNPFHKGHLNILLKAESIFDKVIIARGVNPEKAESTFELPKTLHDRTIVKYNGLLTDCIEAIAKEYGSNPTVIRGLRNSVDLQYEMNQYRYLQDLMPEIKMVSIFCDKEFEHISSSGIRLLSKYGEEKVKNYLVD